MYRWPNPTNSLFQRSNRRLGLAVELSLFGEFRGGDGFDEDADLAVFLVTAVDQVVEGNAFQLAEVAQQEGLEVGGGFTVVAVGAAGWLGDDLVGDAEAKQIAAGELECGGRFGGVLAAFPENRGTTFGAD